MRRFLIAVFFTFIVGLFTSFEASARRVSWQNVQLQPGLVLKNLRCEASVIHYTIVNRTTDPTPIKVKVLLIVTDKDGDPFPGISKDEQDFVLFRRSAERGRFVLNEICESIGNLRIQHKIK